ncbi:DUF1284 domain-containing protein [Polycladidibacter stylochi]|uniref:DUF1284 domain-containing protein n=1 Tax=Polycladidibacter stylochi TaxID=1807766 RepID=UPI00082BB50E|nr:DUF1284 domain-containing protein [Pseudovibrio stylochi]
MIELRGHHLLCILTFEGKGYSPRFTRNYHRIVSALNAGKAVKLVAGPDCICTPLLQEEDMPHCHNTSVLERDKKALALAGQVLGQELLVGAIIEFDAQKVVQLRRAFCEGVFQEACSGCEWHSLCRNIANGGYQRACLQGRCA